MTRPLLFVALLFGLTASVGAQSRLSAEPARPESAAPFARPPGGFEYAYDDGAAGLNIGPPSSFDPDMLWGNYFETVPDGAVVTEIAVAFGPTFPSRDLVTFWLLDDPDADGDPRTGATAIASVQATPDVSGNTFFRVPIPPTPVSAAFFVGASAPLLGGQDRPARVDTDARADRSWFFYAPSIADVIDNLADAPFGTRMDDPTNVPFPGAFMVRAVGVPVTTGAEAAPETGGLALVAGPNPVRGVGTVRLDLDRAQPVTVAVFDALGRAVARLHDGPLAAGLHTLRLDAAGLPSGVYVVHATGTDGVVRQRVTVVR